MIHFYNILEKTKAQKQKSDWLMVAGTESGRAKEFFEVMEMASVFF